MGGWPPGVAACGWLRDSCAELSRLRNLSYEPVEILARAARKQFGLNGKARATSIPAVVCKERATPPGGPKCFRPPGCAAFGFGPRRSSVTDHCGYAPSSLLGQNQNRQQRGPWQYFNRLLKGARDRGTNKTLYR